MRIHTNTLTREDIATAAQLAGATVESLSEHRSRRAARAFELILSGSGRHGGQWGGGDYKSATWDEWGIALAHLFTVDPHAVVPNVYADADDFTWRTGGRYLTLTPADQHIQHRWEWSGEAVTGRYVVRECKCGALTRRPF